MDVQIPPAFCGVGGQAVYIGERRRAGRGERLERLEERDD